MGDENSKKNTVVIQNLVTLRYEDICPPNEDLENIPIGNSPESDRLKSGLSSPEMDASRNKKSTTSRNNSDIFGLRGTTPRFPIENQVDTSVFLGQLNNLHLENCTIDAPDFTVLHAPHTPTTQYDEQQQQRHSASCAFDESTEVLLLQSATVDSNSRPNQAFSGTDSDVEVLMSEEIIDSDWSAGGAGALDDLPDASPKRDGKSDAEVIHMMALATGTNPRNSASASVQQQESTDQDISVEEFSGSSLSAFEDLSRAQLIKVVRTQAMRIRHLEAVLLRCREGHQKLSEHIESLRFSFEMEWAAATAETDFSRSRETIH